MAERDLKRKRTPEWIADNVQSRHDRMLALYEHFIPWPAFIESLRMNPRKPLRDRPKSVV
jgi:hypothetical protein